MDQTFTGDSPLKTERLSGPLLWLTVLLTGGFVSACLAEVIEHVLNQPPTTAGALVEVVWLVMAGGAALSIRVATQRAVTVYSDRIESANGFTTVTLRRSEISGYRRLAGGVINLVSRDEFAKPLTVSAELLRDPLTQNWFDGLPDLGAQDKPAAPDANENDSETQGAGWAGRRVRLAQLLHWTWLLNGAAIVLGIWMFIWPEPHLLLVPVAVAGMLFVIALKLYLGPLVSIASDRGHPDPRPSIQIPFLVPAAVLAVRTLTDFRLVDWLPVLKLAGCAAIIPAALFIAHDRRLRSSVFQILFVAMVLLGFFFGALAEADVIFDTAPPLVFRTLVADKHVSSGKSTTYYVTLAPWGGGPGGDERVSWRFYARMGIGQVVCVDYSNGLLGFRYYRVNDCR